MSRACPLCGGTEVFFISHLEYALFDDSPLQPICDLVACKKCRFMYYDTQTSASALQKYYAENRHYLFGGVGTGSDDEKERYIAITKIIEQYGLGYGAKIVDVGSANGGLLRFLKRRGYTSVRGIDPISGDSADKIPFPDKSVDIIILSHVLEHVLDLQDVIKEADRVLADEGIIYAEVPVIECGSSFEDAPLWDFPHEHINYFTQNHLLELFLNHGFAFLCSHTHYIQNGNGIVVCACATFKKHESVMVPEIPALPQLVTLIQQKTPCYVWGISQYMQLLLGSTNLLQCNVVGFLDKSEYKQTKSIWGIPIKSPEILEGMPKDTVVIFTKEPHGEEMEEYLDENGFNGRRIGL